MNGAKNEQSRRIVIGGGVVVVACGGGVVSDGGQSQLDPMARDAHMLSNLALTHSAPA